MEPILLPEDPTPGEVRDCEKCGLYKQGSRMIWGEGNPDADIFVILDNPGAREDREGNPFVCGTRQALQRAVIEAKVPLENVYITWILKRKPVRAYDKDCTRKTCMYHLQDQLQEHHPSLIMCLGNVAVQSFFQNQEATVKDLRGGWYGVEGYETTVSYHPLAVRRRPNLYSNLLEDWQRVYEKLKEK